MINDVINCRELNKDKAKLLTDMIHQVFNTCDELDVLYFKLLQKT